MLFIIYLILYLLAGYYVAAQHNPGSFLEWAFLTVMWPVIVFMWLISKR